MSEEIRADYYQMDFLPQYWRTGGRRIIRRGLSGTVVIAAKGEQEEPPNFAADLVLKVWLYGYRARLRSA